MGKLLITIGLLGLCHAAYSATQHRNYLRLIETEFTALPGDILLETLLCLLACCFGVINLSTKFKPIQITSEWENKTWDNIANRSSFYSFNHRGKILFSSETSTNKSNLTEKEKRERQNELIRHRLAEAYRNSSESGSNSSSTSDNSDHEQEEDSSSN